MPEFKLRDFYDVNTQSLMLNLEGVKGMLDYIGSVFTRLKILADDAPTKEERSRRFSDIFGVIFSSAVEHEILSTYLLKNNHEDIYKGGFSKNVINLIKELETRRINTPFSG